MDQYMTDRQTNKINIISYLRMYIRVRRFSQFSFIIAVHWHTVAVETPTLLIVVLDAIQYGIKLFNFKWNIYWITFINNVRLMMMVNQSYGCMKVTVT